MTKKYWVKTHTSLIDKKKFFVSPEEYVVWLKQVKKESEDKYRELEIELVEKVYDYEKLTKEEKDAKIKKIKQWPGYDYSELMSSITILSFEEGEGIENSFLCGEE